ncbi:MAG: creatininase family protein [Desulfobacter sp.]|nr:MAG: creatininase family protein [Desulfobacter sp.]
MKIQDMTWAMVETLVKTEKRAVLPLGSVEQHGKLSLGTVTIKMETYLRVVGDILDSMYRSGHRQILIVNGHGGNSFVGGFAQEWLMTHGDARVRLHNWWAAPNTWAKVQEAERGSSHASWMENFPWTEISSVDYETQNSKPPLDLDILHQLGPEDTRAFVQDGNFGGMEKREPELMTQIWKIAVDETRSMLETGWAD